jgi:hypothetical protein
MIHAIFARYLAGASAIALMAGAAFSPIAAQSQQMSSTAKTVKQIDTECGAIQNAIMALHPIHVGFVSNHWKVYSDADYTVAEHSHKSLTLVDAWKQGKSYAWIQAHTFSTTGEQHATQLCFRQSDGTLERARQASSSANLNSASVQQAYFASNGTIIQKSSAFVENDPVLAKKITALPFYNVLP